MSNMEVLFWRVVCPSWEMTVQHSVLRQSMGFCGELLIRNSFCATSVGWVSLRPSCLLTQSKEVESMRSRLQSQVCSLFIYDQRGNYFPHLLLSCVQDGMLPSLGVTLLTRGFAVFGWKILIFPMFTEFNFDPVKYLHRDRSHIQIAVLQWNFSPVL